MADESPIAEPMANSAGASSEFRAVSPRPLPTSFRILVAIYILIGSSAIVIGVVSALQGAFYVSPTVLALAVGIGLFLRRRSWRIVAISLNVVILAGYGIFSFLALTSWDAYRESWENMAILLGEPWSTALSYGAVILSILLIALCLWSTGLLTRLHIRELFLSSPVSDRLTTFLILLFLATVVRETGGLNLNLSATWFASLILSVDGPSSQPRFELELPVMAEIHGPSGDSLMIISAKKVTERETPFGLENKQTWTIKRLNGQLASSIRARAPERAQTVQIKVNRLQLQGGYWLPFVKSGIASFETTTQGTGALSQYRCSQHGEFEFNVIGICSVYRLRQKLQNQVAAMALEAFLDSANIEFDDEPWQDRDRQ